MTPSPKDLELAKEIATKFYDIPPCKTNLENEIAQALSKVRQEENEAQNGVIASQLEHITFLNGEISSLEELLERALIGLMCNSKREETEQLVNDIRIAQSIRLRNQEGKGEK